MHLAWQRHVNREAPGTSASLDTWSVVSPTIAFAVTVTVTTAK
jgi:hypothetical protein